MILPHRKTRLGRQAQFRQSSAQNLPKLLLTGICTISKGRHLGLNSSQLNRIVNAKYLRLFWNPTTPFIYCKVIVSSNRHGGVEVECSPRMREIGLDPRLQQTSVVKTGSDNSTAKHSATVVLGDDHYPSIGQSLQPFTGNGYVSIWVKKSWARR